MAANRLDALEERLGHRFADRALLERALTHASYGDGRGGVRNNERLEFLGDRVLGLIVARRLFETFDTADEGGLAPRLNALVRKEACARAARRADLGDALRMSKAEDRRGGRNNTSILGDACEAVMAALYLDGGLPAAERFFDAFWADELQRMIARPNDPKTALQHWTLANGLDIPRYTTVERTGPDHEPSFVVEVAVTRHHPERGRGGSKQDAERAAAAAFLEREGVDV